MKRLTKYLTVMILPLCVLLARPLTPALVLLLGEEIRLETTPVDPRDIFRGDYVNLRFAIEEISETLLSPELKGELAEGARYLYVSLEPREDGIWDPVLVTPAPPPKGVYIRAFLAYGSRYSDRVYLDYGNGLSRFYVKENTGLELERAAQRGKIEALAKVWKGRVVLEDIKALEE